MKYFLLIIFSLMLAFSAQTQVSKTITISAGSLGVSLTLTELNTIMSLVVTGTMDARDFKTIRDRMPSLTEVNLQGASVAAYSGKEGTVFNSNKSYPDNTVPQQAFYDKTKLTSILLPSETVSIGDFAFRGCTSLKTLNIPESVASMGSSILAGCTSLTTIKIPSSLQALGNSVFSTWTGLTAIDIPETVTSIGNSSFWGCINLKSIVIPESVASIGQSAFYNCKNLISVTLPNSIKTIENYTFYDCKGLISIQLPSPLTTVGGSVFANCSSLKSLNLPLGVLSIGATAFFGCKGLDSMFIPSSVISIGRSAFSSTKALIVVHENNLNYSSLEGVLFDKKKDTLFHCPVSKSGDYTMPSTVKVIKEHAFNSCSELTSIILSSLLTTVGENAFYNCKGLTEMNLPSSLRSIGNNAFNGCSGLKSITVPDSITVIANSTFNRCSGLTSIILPPGITSFGDYAFSGCSGLTSFNVPISLKHIGRGTFFGCKGIKTITIPASVSTIGSSAFSNCSGLTSIYAYNRIPVDLYNSPYVFSGVNKTTCKLYVPYGTAKKYAKDYQWKDFSQIIEMAGFSLASHSIYLYSAVDSYASVKLSSNVQWEASSDQSWLRVLPGSGTDSTELIIFAEKNVSGTSRSATITVTSPGLEVETIIVTQQSVIASVNYSDVTGCYGMANGSITFYDALGYQEVEYSIDGGESWRQDTSFTELIAKTYDLRIRDPNYANKNFSLGSITLKEPVKMQAWVEGLNTIYCGWYDPYIRIQEPRGGSGYYEYSFDEGQTWQSDPMFSYWGWYTEQYVVVMIRDAQSPDCEVKLDEGYIYYTEPVWADAQITEIDLAKEQLGAIQLNVYGGMGYYQYYWNTGESTKDIENLKGGYYWVEIFDGFGCIYQYSFTLNTPPIAHAGTNQIASSGTQVVLDGTASSDADKNILSYKWTAPAGITLSSATDMRPTFTAPVVDKLTVFAFILIVNDGKTDSEPSEVMIIVCPPLRISEDIILCAGKSYHGWTETGIYSRTLKSISGCDSIVTTNLTVLPKKEVTEEIFLCQGESYLQWSESGNYKRILLSSSGCDSTVTTILTVHPAYQVSESISICEGDSYKEWTTSGTYTQTFNTITGCDSIVTTHLTVHPASQLTENVTICEGDQYNGWTATGNHQRTLKTTHGCDSVVTTNLTVNRAYNLTEDVKICEGDSYQSWTTSGLYQRALKSISDCDSLVTTNLTVYPYFKPVIIVQGDTLISEGNYKAYQWNDATGLISGATGKEYIIVKSGRYHLVINDENGCTQNSEVLSMIHSDIKVAQQEAFKYTIVPNPNTGQFAFRMDSQPSGDITLKLINPIGQVLETRMLRMPSAIREEQFNVNRLGKGMYFLQIAGVTFQDVAKIIVQ